MEGLLIIIVKICFNYERGAQGITLENWTGLTLGKLVKCTILFIFRL
jgi:hypothetical protein